MSTPDDLEHRIEKLRITTRAKTDEHILDDAFEELESSALKKAAVSRRSVFLKAIRNRTKELVAVAALVLVVFALFFSSPSAKAVSLAEIYQALEKVKNVCILTFVPGREEPLQKNWKARFMRIWLLERRNHKVLRNLQNWTKKEIDKSINLYSETPIQPDMQQKLEHSFTNSFGFLPFSDIKAVKNDAEWKRVDDETIAVSIPGTEVYDLIWNEPVDNYITEYYKWRVFVDIQTDLPIRTEWYQKTNVNGEYALQTIKIITYPTDNEIKAHVREVFGDVEQQTAEPEDFNNPGTTQTSIDTE